ncbi:hypothetical protein [Caulobacter sp. NIBR1757]|uniref:hypothetical protein n=1 Tax=Caulobacter sp. NIBR1757 TaxID=3016000 RepID=UPI0022F0F390|nr:hypothetical protein [Caulobacter sp. NIBR1757]WGM41089.1 hypothetical protein AMEJIAPC_04037 [Caulobacter sp. NIBR1757]
MNVQILDRGKDPDALLRLVATQYPKAALRFLRPLADLLCVARDACGGDFDKFLIMLAVAIRTTEHPLFATYAQEELLDGTIPVFPSLGTNVRSVADSLGLPKETVRRKVGDLVDAGWIVRQGNELRFTDHAYRELAGARVGIERLAVRNFEVVADLIRKASPPCPDGELRQACG